MKAWVELSCWVATDDPVTLGDIDRLTETLRVYLESVGGIPRIDHYIHGDTVCITASSEPGKPHAKAVDKLYMRSSVLKALNTAGMELPKEKE